MKRPIILILSLSVAALTTGVARAMTASAHNSGATYANSAAHEIPRGDMIIPAGKIATLSGAMFGAGTFNCPENLLEYGYQLNGGTNVSLAVGNGCEDAPGTTLGPFPTPTLLRIWLTDLYPPPFTFYSDENHALVTTRTNVGLLPPWTVSIMDSYYGFCGTDCPRPPTAPGTGNFNVTIAIS